MSNSNIEPMPFRRQFGGGANANGHTATSRTLADLAAAVSVPQDEDAFVGEWTYFVYLDSSR